MSKAKKLPKGWRLSTLAKVASIEGGMSAPQNKQVFKGGRIPFVRMKDLGRYHQTDCLTETDDYLREDFVAQKKAKIYQTKSILIPRSGSVYLNHRAMLGVNACVVGHIAVLSAFEDVILPEYLYYFLCTVDMGRWSPRTTGLDSLNFSVVTEKIEIPLPLLPVQERIVELLQQADAIRHKRAETHRLTDQILPAVFHKMFGNPGARQDLGKLDTVIESIRNGITKRRKIIENKGIIVLRIQDVGDGYIDFDNVNRIELSEKEKSPFLLQEGDMLLVRVNGNKDLVGRNSLFHSYFEPVGHNDHLMRIRFDREKAIPEYISAFLRTPFGKHELVERFLNNIAYL